MDPLKLLDTLRHRPGRLLPERRYATVVACLIGYDLAAHGGLLHGFQEFAELRARRRTALHWSSLVLRLGDPDRPAPPRPEPDKVALLLDLLEEFLAVDRAQPGGLRRLFHEHTLMCQARPAYDAAAERAAGLPPGDAGTVNLTQAADLLGADHRAVLALVRAGRLGRVVRRGAEARVDRAAVERLRAEREAGASETTAGPDAVSSPESRLGVPAVD